MSRHSPARCRQHRGKQVCRLRECAKGIAAEEEQTLPMLFFWGTAEDAVHCHSMWSAIGQWDVPSWKNRARHML